jgi:Tfp pilus assembly protein PilF
MPALVLVVVAVAIHITSLANGFVFDDLPQIVDNVWLRDFAHLREIFTSDVWGFRAKESNYYRPLMHVCYLLLYQANGASPVVFHAFNLLVHGTATLGVFILLMKLVPSRVDNAFATPAFLASLVFATHPAHVEAAVWASALPDLGMAAACIWAVYWYLEADAVARRSLHLHALGAIAFFVATLLKEPGVMLPAVLLAIDVTRRFPRRDFVYWLTRYGLLLGAAATYFLLRLNALDGMAPHASVANFSIVRAIEFVGTALWRYLAMLVYPHPLNMFQTLDSAPGLPTLIPVIGLPLGLLMAVTRRNVAWTAALGLFLIPLAPALYAPALLPGLDNPWAERYAYLPSAGFAIGLATIMSYAQQHVVIRRATLTATLALTTVFAGMTVARIPVWRDDLTLWADTVAKSPSAGAARGALGYALFARGDVDRAIAEYQAAVLLKPDHADSYLNLGVALALKGQHAQAAGLYEEALRLQPRNPMAHANLALALSALGRHDDAISAARRAVALAPGEAASHHAVGVSLGNAGQIAAAADAFRRATQIDPTNAQSRANLERAEDYMRRQPVVTTGPPEPPTGGHQSKSPR